MPGTSTGAVPPWLSSTGRPGLPPGFGVALDDRTRRIDGGRVLVGGAPLRVLRLGAAGVGLVDRWASGAPVPDDAAATELARRLTDTGLAHPAPPHPAPPATAHPKPPATAPPATAHPKPPATAPPATAHPTVAVVVPVRDDVAGLRRLLPGLLDGVAAVVVVDDGSVDPEAVTAAVDDASAAAARAGVTLSTCRHSRSRGPGAARTTGIGATDAELVAFVDADVTVAAGWLAPLVAHFADPCVAAVAPRVAAGEPPPRGSGSSGGEALPHGSGSSGGEPLPHGSGSPGSTGGILLRYERLRSPLDLGDRPAIVRPGGTVPYVPSAAMLVRRAALDAVGGFDPDLRVGEDVDLVWRLTGAGGVVRYEPAVTVLHAVRPGAGAWLAQRFRYGTSAAVLADRHPGSLASVHLSGHSMTAWSLVAAGRPAAGLCLAGASTAALARRLPGVDHPARLAARLGGPGHLAAGGALAAACRREWWPLAALAAARWRRLRPALALAAAGPPLWRWARARPSMGPGTWLALHLCDDAAYGAGVWAGCARRRTVAPLLPRLVWWPGRRGPAAAAPPRDGTMRPGPSRRPDGTSHRSGLQL